MAEEFVVSEWNEAMFKMKRLHEAQERINFWKRDKKAITDGKFHYEWWFEDCDVLLGEGKAKYKVDEKKECERIKKIIQFKLDNTPPHSRIIVANSGGRSEGYVLDEKRFKEVVELVQKFEDLAKEYNDKHGLSTKNQGSSGLF
jgi:hypothetical protein